MICYSLGSSPILVILLRFVWFSLLDNYIRVSQLTYTKNMTPKSTASASYFVSFSGVGAKLAPYPKRTESRDPCWSGQVHARVCALRVHIIPAHHVTAYGLVRAPLPLSLTPPLEIDFSASS